MNGFATDVKMFWMNSALNATQNRSLFYHRQQNAFSVRGNAIWLQFNLHRLY